LQKRMTDRGFSEVDLRHLLEYPMLVEPTAGGLRWRVESRLRGSAWTVIVEPDEVEHVVVVVTAWNNTEATA